VGRRQQTAEQQEPFDSLISDAVFCREFDISRQTLQYRWDKDEALIAAGLPPRVKIQNHNYCSRKLTERFKAWLFKQAVKQRANRGA
jgi:hypothetical protein